MQAQVSTMSEAVGALRSTNDCLAVSTPTPTMAGQAINPVVGSEAALIEGLKKEIALLKQQVSTLRGRVCN